MQQSDREKAIHAAINNNTGKSRDALGRSSGDEQVKITKKNNITHNVNKIKGHFTKIQMERNEGKRANAAHNTAKAKANQQQKDAIDAGQQDVKNRLKLLEKLRHGTIGPDEYAKLTETDIGNKSDRLPKNYHKNIEKWRTRFIKKKIKPLEKEIDGRKKFKAELVKQINELEQNEYLQEIYRNEIIELKQKLKESDASLYEKEYELKDFNTAFNQHDRGMYSDASDKAPHESLQRFKDNAAQRKRDFERFHEPTAAFPGGATHKRRSTDKHDYGKIVSRLPKSKRGNRTLHERVARMDENWQPIYEQNNPTDTQENQTHQPVPPKTNESSKIAYFMGGQGQR